MKYFLIAGEASGDLHAADLIRSLKERDPEARFAFLGGDLMAEAAGSEPVIHYRDMAFMGFTEILKHAGAIRRNFKAAKAAIKEWRPDCVILIDYPSFNLRMAEFARKLGIPAHYYIPPKVWAWKEWRVKDIKKLIDKVLCIFPFEVEFYAKHGIKADYVGNPSVLEVDRYMAQAPSREEFIKENHLQDKPIIALLPGSRLSEIRVNMPIMAYAMKQFPQYRGVVAGAPGVDPEFYKQFSSLPVVFGQTYGLLANARAALVTSGTATLETALAGVPQVAMFRHNGSKLFYRLMRKVLKIDFVTLPNLIAGRRIIPEMLLHLCTADACAAELGKLLPDREPRRQMQADYAAMRAILGTSSAPDTAARLLV
ncbi:MAG: lipid-A-disaccharide synthase [Lachnospiraceae bacterium]|nr:lipid-A-disaccharide synthase [Lachnospiraceae bacterium]